MTFIYEIETSKRFQPHVNERNHAVFLSSAVIITGVYGVSVPFVHNVDSVSAS